MISSRVNNIKPSLTIATNMKAQELKRAGKDIIVLAAGEPDFDTPEHIKNAAIKAINNGFTKYVPGKGTPDLQQAIQKKFKQDNGLDYDLSNITVGVGGKHIIYNAFSATINSGDEVIIPAPYWVSYPDIVILNDGVPVVVECGEESGFKLNPEDLEKNITKKTKWLMLNSPSNPTGSLYSKQELIALGEILKKHEQVYVLSDDIYEKIVYDNHKFHTFAEVCPDLKDRTLTMNGLSKSYCMTGWRVGYAAGPSNVINAMNKVQSQNVSSTASISMAASVEALNGDQSFISSNNESFLRRRNLVVKHLNETPGLSCRTPEGAFYVFASCKGVLGKKTETGKILNTDGDFMDYLLEDVGVAGVQGSAFGLEGFFRISYATSDSILEDACQRIKNACSRLS
ncbi:pyridoxal phosphate-dependent aminotransferase [Alphaproteobacteria bacterium]|nr:pyridoxal phosphate-dependent aminotransferase [Alphaproteobacteria bacterium]MDB3974305.1 pyridoxal phosphate-dependent aminotransferase [Alphaproteobacteria bacterium]